MLYRYKPEEGRNARQIAFWVGMLIISYGCYRMSGYLDRFASIRGSLIDGFEKIPILGLPVTGSNLIALAAFGLSTWLWVRFLAKVKTVDHMIEVEGEMKKVTWPSFKEASNSSIVVITTVLILMGYLALADWVLGGLAKFALWDRVAS